LKQFKNKDAILWEKFKDGDINALGSLYDLFIDDLYAYGIQFSQDKHYVMDCIHDLFLNLYKYRKKIAYTDNVGYYLAKSLKNQILKPAKLTLSKHTYEEKNFCTSFEDDLIASEITNEREYKLSKAINLLSKKQRQGLYLRFTEEKQYEEIAEIMNISVQTSRTIIYRAIKVLRKNLSILMSFLLSIY